MQMPPKKLRKKLGYKNFLKQNNKGWLCHPLFIKTKNMEKKVFKATDLGPGDGGKGGVVHKLCTYKKAHTVIKAGGAQGSHGVRTSAGESFNFSQFGCGTLEGIKTHISKIMIIEPYRLFEEGNHLIYENGIRNAFDLMTVDRDALCVIPFHTISSKLRELTRGKNPKGTVGVGVGEASYDAELHPNTAIYVRDIGTPILREKLEHILIQKRKDLIPVFDLIPSLNPLDMKIAQENIKLFNDEKFIDRIVGNFNQTMSLVKVVDEEYLAKEILSRPGVAVFEASHGILTDRYYGFHPHTTKLRTIPHGIDKLLADCGYDGQVIGLGVSRAYQIRHGAGPMVTESPELLDNLLPDSHKDDNRWQGKVRVGPLDLVSLRYSIEVCGGPEYFDGLAITWLDQIKKFGRWDVCVGYEGYDEKFFSSSSHMNVRRGSDEEQLNYQQALGQNLLQCKPIIKSYDVSSMAEGELIELCSNVLVDALGVPVRMASLGPTEDQKICL